MIEKKLGPKAVAKDFWEMGLEDTPTFEKFEYDSVEGKPDEPPEKLEPTPGISTDIYLNESIVLPQGDRLVQGKIFRRQIEVDGNTIVRKNQNPIIYTHRYEVDFTNREVTEINANVIAERIYAQCDKDGNYMWMLVFFVIERQSERYRCKIRNWW